MLHALLVLLFEPRLSVSSTVNTAAQTVTIELMGTTIVNKPHTQKPASVTTANAIPEAAKAELPAAPDSTNEQQTSSSKTEPSSANLAASDPVVESGSSSLNIQPLSSLTHLPAFLHKADPVYPSTEQRAGSQAHVLAEITLDERGNILDVKIIKSAGNAFDKAVTDALKKSAFTPGYIGSDAVAVRVRVPFRFNLK